MTFYFRYFTLFFLCFTLFGQLQFSQAETLASTEKINQKSPSLRCETSGLLFFYHAQAIPFPQNLICENKGNAPILIKNVAWTNANDPFFSFSNLAQKKIEPGKRFTIQVSFKPASLAAQASYQNELILTSNDEKQSALHFLIKAENAKTPLVVLQKNKDGMLEPATSLDFGTSKQTQTQVRTLILRWVGNTARSTYSVSIDGTDANAFGISSPPANAIPEAGGENLYVSFIPSKVATNDSSRYDLFSEYRRTNNYTASLHIQYQVEQAGKQQSGEITISPIQGSTERIPSNEPNQNLSEPDVSPRSRFGLSFELGPGFMLFPDQVYQFTDGQYGVSTPVLKAFFLSKLKGNINLLSPGRGHSYGGFIDLKLNPYIEIGTVEQHYENYANTYAYPIFGGLGAELETDLYLDSKNLVAISLTSGIGYAYVDGVYTFTSSSKSTNFKNSYPQTSITITPEPPILNHHLRINSGIGLSIGFDRWTDIKGIDLYLGAQFFSMFSFPKDKVHSVGYGLGAFFPIGVRYTFK